MTSLDLARVGVILKEVRRAGWVRVGVPAPVNTAESVADHSWSVALLAALLCPPDVNREKLLLMAILHDLAEVRVGDITPHDGISPEEKHRREDEAMAELLADHAELLGLWREAETRETPEAKLLKELDRLELRLQADRYAALGVIDEATADEFRRPAPVPGPNPQNSKKS